MLAAPLQFPTPRLIDLGAASPLPVARYRFGVRMQQPLVLPPYAGGLLRGQFGAALRHLDCTVSDGHCKPCHRYRTCAYPTVFDSPVPSGDPDASVPEIPNPYVIEPPGMETRRVAAGDLLVFHMVLIGGALAHLSLIAAAWRRAFRLGLGRERSVGELESIEWQQQRGPALSVWDPVTERITPHEAHLVIPRFDTVGRIDISLRTPLRLQQRGTFVDSNQLRPAHLLAAIARRASLLLHFHAGFAYTSHMSMCLRDVEALRDQKALAWWDWTRYSSRQRREMTLGGLLGQWTIEGDITRWLPWLWLGERLHAGKNSTFGLGQFELRYRA